VMDAPTLPVSAEKNLGDPIENRVDIVHPAPADVFLAMTMVRTLAQHGEAIQDIHGHLQGTGEKGSYGVRATVGFSSGVPATRPREL
nr:hypothetical protein [Tanacetum cinerariifolium]